MKAIWLHHADDRKRIEQEFLASNFLLETLERILEYKLQESIKKTRSLEAYTLPKWEQFVSDQFGYQRALDEVKTLIQTKEK